MAAKKPDWREQAKSHAFIIGADECGLGSWAGPLIVCAVSVPTNWSPPRGLNDSKKLRKAEHERLYYILKTGVTSLVEMAHSDEIDRVGITTALKRCYRTVVQGLRERYPDSFVILDGEVTIPEVPHISFPRADGEVPAVMAASVIGKYIHDRYMLTMAEKYQGYGFGSNVGYGTPEHQAGIQKLGLTPIHRKSYAPMGKLKTAVEMAQADDEGMAVDED